MLNVEEVLGNLVKYNTIKDKENKEILDYIDKELTLLGFKTEKKDKVLIMSNKEVQTIGFLGHTDTVEATSEWKYKKFETTKVEDKLYGLGVCDMKAGIAAIITAISQINFESLSKGMKLYFSYDEEIGFSGIKDIVKYEEKFPQRMIIGEPTNNEIIVGSKGLMEYKISFTGIKTHSSTPNKGKNAIMSAISFINELNEFYINEIQKIEDLNFEIPYTTMNVGKINGGTEINSVPDFCEVLVDFRTIGEEAESKIEEEIEKLQKKYSANINKINKLPAFFNKSNVSNKTCNFITEASFIKSDCMILGAGPVTAHEINEYISIDSLYELVEQYKDIILANCK